MPPGTPEEVTPEEAPVAAPLTAVEVEAAPPTDEHQPSSYWFFGVVAFVSAALDLVTKEFATKHLTGPKRVFSKDEDYVLIKGLFELRHARNEGGAWSALTSLPEIWRRPFFLFVATAASVFITSIYARIDNRDRFMKWGLPLALGGAIGNLVDRVRHGHVVDFLHMFIDWKGQRKNWPTFNVADVWIVVGVSLMAISLLFGRSRAQLYKDDG